MGDWQRAPRLRLRRWPTQDWDATHGVYRFIKGAFQLPVSWSTRLQVRGRERFPKQGGVILAANHLSWADPVVIGAAVDRPTFYIAKDAVFKNAAASRFFESMGVIKVNREIGGNEPAVQAAVSLLERDLVLGIFPEGTRSRPGHIKRGKTGVARIAALSGAPVVPVAVDTGDFWPKSRVFPKWGQRVYVNIGEPMRFDLKPEDALDRQRMREVTDQVMDRVRALYFEAIAASESQERWS